MDVMFLGTGAAEQISSIYCRCDFCDGCARKAERTSALAHHCGLGSATRSISGQTRTGR